MCRTVHLAYRGWDITIRCSPRSRSSNDADLETYTAIAEAELQPDEDPNNWIDPRVQLMSTENEFFKSGNLCVEDLLFQMRELIDALAR